MVDGQAALGTSSQRLDAAADAGAAERVAARRDVRLANEVEADRTHEVRRNVTRAALYAVECGR